MITGVIGTPPEVRLEQMKMALAEVGEDASDFYVGEENRIYGPIRNPVNFWRATQLTCTHWIYCFRCWEADEYVAGDHCVSCRAWLGVFDCRARKP